MEIEDTANVPFPVKLTGLLGGAKHRDPKSISHYKKLSHFLIFTLQVLLVEDGRENREQRMCRNLSREKSRGGGRPPDLEKGCLSGH